MAKELQEHNLINLKQPKNLVAKYTYHTSKSVKTKLTQRLGMYRSSQVSELQVKTRKSWKYAWPKCKCKKILCKYLMTVSS